MKKRNTLTLMALVLVLAAILVAPAGAQQTEYANNGWYTGLEHKDMPSQAAVQNEYSNNGWYTGLEHADLPASPAASDSDSVAWDQMTLGVAAALAAALLAATVVTTRTRSRRVAA